jgi:acyl carrier protein
MSIEKVQDVFREVFDNPELKIFPEMTPKDDEDWDSFGHIKLVLALESAFDISFSTDEIAELYNVGDMIKILQHKGIDVSL